jgi:hypothetical protein
MLFLSGLKTLKIQVASVIMVSIVFNMCSYQVERIDSSCQYLMGRFRIYVGLHQEKTSLLFLVYNQQLLLFMIRIAILYLSLERDTEIQLECVHFQILFLWVVLVIWQEKLIFGVWILAKRLARLKHIAQSQLIGHLILNML